MDKRKVFFTACTLTLTAGITIYSVSSDKPDNTPVISTYQNSIYETTRIYETNESSEIQIKYPIDLNYATKEELCSLDGIGDVLSEKIIKYRNEHYFYSVEEITEVDGIGNKFLETNKDKIFVDISKLPEITTIIHNAAVITVSTTDKPQETETAVTVSETTVSDTAKQTTTHETELITTEKEIEPVNLNTATYEELTALPISHETAEQILDLRDKIGYFSSTEELCYIENFSRELYKELIRYVYV